MRVRVLVVSATVGVYVRVHAVHIHGDSGDPERSVFYLPSHYDDEMIGKDGHQVHGDPRDSLLLYQLQRMMKGDQIIQPDYVNHAEIGIENDKVE